MHKQKVTKLYSENNIRLKVTQMECIDNHKIDYNGGRGEGVPRRQRHIHSKFDPSILPKDQPQYCLW